MQYGTVLLKCEHETMPDIIEEMMQDLVDSGHMNKENREQLKSTLLSRRRSTRNKETQQNSGSSIGGAIRKKSTLSEFFPYGSRRQSTFTTADHASVNSDNASINASRKSSAVQLSDLNISKSKNKKLSMSDANLLNRNSQAASISSQQLNDNGSGSGSGSGRLVLQSQQHHTTLFNTHNQHHHHHNDNNTVKFSGSTVNCTSIDHNLPAAVTTTATTGVTGGGGGGESLLQSKRRRSTIAMLKSTLTQSAKLNKSESRLSVKGVSSDAESFMVLVGVVDYLDRPVMSFVRLANSQIIDDFGDIRVKFVFVLLGPKNDHIDYMEIGRCMGTLMTNKEFHDCAYRANERRELIEGITSFINRSLCLVVPVGDFDNDLMLPIVEWMRVKIKNKMGKHNCDTKIYDKCVTPFSANKHKTRFMSSFGVGGTLSTKSSCVGGEYQRNKSVEVMLSSSNQGGKSSKFGGPSGEGEGGDGGEGDEDEADDFYNTSCNDNVLIYNHEYDPFLKTGRLFGNLMRELKYRYALYCSDFKDALNIHCFIAFIFIFTVCIATALSFGGILGKK